eukprot:PhF_6_TR8660/c0_g1_i1/m.13538
MTTVPPTSPKIDRQQSFDSLFKKWDLDGNGVVDMHEMRQVLHALNKGQNKSERKVILKFLAKLRYKYTEPNVAPLSPEEFKTLLNGLTADISDDDFQNFVRSLEKYIAEASTLSVDSRMSKKVFELFSLLDGNGNGLLEFEELMIVVSTETKGLRKNVLRWKSKLMQDQGTTVRAQMTLAQFQSFMREHFKDFVDKEEEFIAKVEEVIAAAHKSEVLQGLRYLVQQRVVDIVED